MCLPRFALCGRETIEKLIFQAQAQVIGGGSSPDSGERCGWGTASWTSQMVNRLAAHLHLHKSRLPAPKEG